MTTKIVKNIDNKVWNKLAGNAKINDRLVGEYLCEILEEYFNHD